MRKRHCPPALKLGGKGQRVEDQKTMSKKYLKDIGM